MSDQIIDMKMTKQEANAMLRAIAIHNSSERAEKSDIPPCDWVAQRLLTILPPELGSKPILAIFSRNAEHEKEQLARKPKKKVKSKK